MLTRAALILARRANTRFSSIDHVYNGNRKVKKQKYGLKPSFTEINLPGVMNLLLVSNYIDILRNGNGPSHTEIDRKSGNTEMDSIIDIVHKYDVKKGVYEGGLKVWECSLSLAIYLKDQGVSFSNKTVLELGCGHGVPGVLAINVLSFNCLTIEFGR